MTTTTAQAIEVLKMWESVKFADGTTIRREPAGYHIFNDGAGLYVTLEEAQAAAEMHHKIGVAIQILRDSRMGASLCAESLINGGADRRIIDAALDCVVLF